MIYFDNAASSHPKPESVYQNTFRFLRENGANSGRSGHDMAVRAAEKIYETRAAVSRFFGTDAPENVVFTSGATHALNLTLYGLLRPGDHVITTTLEHNSVLRPLYALQRRGVRLDVITPDLYDDAITVRRIRQKIRKETRSIVMTQCSNVCGKILPVRAVAELKTNRIRLVVDGSQGAGSIPTDLKDLGADYYCAPSHKGLLGWQGAGFVICRKDELRPLMSGGTGGDSAARFMPSDLPDRLEAGTLPAPAIVSLGEGIRFLEKRGVENVYQDKRRLTDELFFALKEISGVHLYADAARVSSPGVLCFNLGDVSSAEAADALNARGVAVRGGLHCAPLFHKMMGTERRGMVRVSLGCATRPEEIKRLLQILREYLQKK